MRSNKLSNLLSLLFLAATLGVALYAAFVKDTIVVHWGPLGGRELQGMSYLILSYFFPFYLLHFTCCCARERKTLSPSTQSTICPKRRVTRNNCADMLMCFLWVLRVCCCTSRFVRQVSCPWYPSWWCLSWPFSSYIMCVRDVNREEGRAV